MRSSIKDNNVNFISGDILKYEFNKTFDIWHDRAVMHFFLKEEEYEKYFYQVNKYLNKDGFFILSTFSKSNLNKCTGLKIKRWNEEEVLSHLGRSFRLIKAYDFKYIMPTGDTRIFRYMLFKKIF